MMVQVIACTQLISWPKEYKPHTKAKFSGTMLPYEDDIDELAEIAGRLCYESWERPNPNTATNEGYLRNIIGQKHFSVLEHGSVTFYIEGVSRSLLAELSRHRHLSLSVLSQRYVNHGMKTDKTVVIPPVAAGNIDFIENLEGHMDEAKYLYDKYVKELMEAGCTRKEAHGAARAFLPEATETKMIVTGNLRTWREIIEKRNSLGADEEIRTLAQQILAELKGIAPNSVQDMEL